jgi:hypothetical protein
MESKGKYVMKKPLLALGILASVLTMGCSGLHPVNGEYGYTYDLIEPFPRDPVPHTMVYTEPATVFETNRTASATIQIQEPSAPVEIVTPLKAETPTTITVAPVVTAPVSSDTTTPEQTATAPAKVEEPSGAEKR